MIHALLMTVDGLATGLKTSPISGLPSAAVNIKKEAGGWSRDLSFHLQDPGSSGLI